MTHGPPLPVALETSGLVRRAIASLLDAVPAITLWGVASLTMLGAGGVSLPPSQWNLLDRLVDIFNVNPGLIGWPLVWLTMAMVLWHFLTVAMWGVSPGKRVVGLRLCDNRGRRLGAVRALVHALMRPVTVALLALGPLWALADPERRTLYDRISGVYVATSLGADGPGRG